MLPPSSSIEIAPPEPRSHHIWVDEISVLASQKRQPQEALNEPADKKWFSTAV